MASIKLHLVKSINYNIHMSENIIEIKGLQFQLMRLKF